MRVFIGTTRLRGSFPAYAERFDLLELRSDAPNLPRPNRLAQWAEQGGDGFAFSIVLPKSTGLLNIDAQGEVELERALATAEALHAAWLVLRTPASVGPSARIQARLCGLAERLRGSGRYVAWEPHGPWQDALAESLAVEAGLSLVRDFSRSPSPNGPRVYTRLLERGSSLRGSALRRVAEQLQDCELAAVVVEGGAAAWAAAQLRKELAAQAAADREQIAEADPQSGSGARQ